jgi:hypothetical protein
LTAPVRGTSEFQREFPQRGPRDSRGRSLRDFDLQRRIFRYPLSYLVYSAAFEGLPDAARDYCIGRIGQVLAGADTSGRFAHLSADDRQALTEIVRNTLPAWVQGRFSIEREARP